MNVAMGLQSPWRDRRGKFSPLKAVTLALIVAVPTYAVVTPIIKDEVGAKPEIYLIYATGVWATTVLLLSLSVTPARRILGLTQLIAVRRMIGVTALAYTVVHCIDFPWLLRYNLTIIGEQFLRPTIWVATAATIGLVALGATSLDAAVAKLGSEGWHRLHSLIYPVTGLAILHFDMSGNSLAGTPFLMTGLYFWLMAWRVLDRFGKGADAAALIGLAVVAAALSLTFEVTWLFFYQHIPVAQTLGDAMRLTYGLPTTWQVLVIGLTVALLPAALAASRKRAPLAVSPNVR